MNNNIAVFIFKTLVIIIFLLLILSVVNSLALIYSIRPSIVMVYFIFGGVVANVALTATDKILLKKDDPLPEYVLKQVELNSSQVAVIKKIIDQQYNVTEEEVKIRAKAQKRVEDDNKKDEKEKGY